MSLLIGSARRFSFLAALLLIAASCGGSEGETAVALGSESVAAVDSRSDNDAASRAGSSSGPTAAGSFVEIGGEVYEFTNLLDCVVGDAFWGPEFRRISFDSDGNFPSISVGYAPPKADDEGVTNPNAVAVFPSADPWWYSTDAASIDDYELTLTPDGVKGSATLGVVGDGGPAQEQHARFELSCSDPSEQESGSASDTGTSAGSDSGAGAGNSTTEPDLDVGTVTLAGETTELTGPSRSDALIDPDAVDASSGFDFEICETVNPAFAGEFNIGGTLADGTRFRLSGTVGEAFGEFDGLVLGRIPDEERADNVIVSLDGRTLSGTAATSRGEMVFSFTC